MIEVKSGELTLTILNSIIAGHRNVESSGIGIKNIIRRLDLLYQDSYLLESFAEKDIFKVNLKIKLKK
jgi:sensor histidine kinase YesM